MVLPSSCLTPARHATSSRVNGRTRAAAWSRSRRARTAASDDDRLALVTGATRGLGREIARQLAARRLRVFVGARRRQDGEAVAASIGHGAAVLVLDVASTASVAAAFERLAEERGWLDVLVNNAGVDYDTDQQAGEADLARVRRAFDVNLFGAWDCARAALPLLHRGTSPRLVNVSSGAGSLATMEDGPPGYSTSKAALNALTRLLAAEERESGSGVLVNAVCPGWVATELGGSGGRPVAEGASGVVWAATLPDDGPTGGFFRDGVPLDW